MEVNFYLIAADIVLIVHTAFIAFVVLGLFFTVLGLKRSWNWIRNFRFRLLHLLSIAGVAMQSWFGMVCPLTTLEQVLRKKGTGESYSGDFIAYWLHKLIFFRAEPWIFSLLYSIFGSLVLFTWIMAPPERSNKQNENSPFPNDK
ncbi:MAG: DUF2784 domain-containing protein [SAR324 cluster bacterium]|nr:DUF2784 domain-containing protein [SAR324 cluster bacterium]